LDDGKIDVDHVLQQFWRRETGSRGSIHYVFQWQLKANVGVATAV
jgi:hypothetical protein